MQQTHVFLCRIHLGLRRDKVSQLFALKTTFCLFCRHEANEENETKKPKDFRREIYRVAKISFKDTIVKEAQKNSDNFAKTFFVLIGCDNNLVAVEAKYHIDCFHSFLKSTTGGKSGRLVLLHNPFLQIQKIMPITSRITGNEKINCHNARKFLIISMTKVIDKKFYNIKLKRAERLLPLLTVNSAVKFHDEKVSIDHLLLFQCMNKLSSL